MWLFCRIFFLLFFKFITRRNIAIRVDCSLFFTLRNSFGRRVRTQTTGNQILFHSKYPMCLLCPIFIATNCDKMCFPWLLNRIWIWICFFFLYRKWDIKINCLNRSHDGSEHRKYITRKQYKVANWISGDRKIKPLCTHTKKPWHPIDICFLIWSPNKETSNK